MPLFEGPALLGGQWRTRQAQMVGPFCSASRRSLLAASSGSRPAWGGTGSTNDGKLRLTRREDKFQELVTALYDHRHWLKALGNSGAFGAAELLEVSPMARLRAIAALYFPTYRQALTKLDAAADHYEMWTFPAGQERLSKGKLEQVTLEAGRKAYGPYAEAFRELVDGLEEFAAKEFRGEAE